MLHRIGYFGMMHLRGGYLVDWTIINCDFKAGEINLLRTMLNEIIVVLTLSSRSRFINKSRLGTKEEGVLSKLTLIVLLGSFHRKASDSHAVSSDDSTEHSHLGGFSAADISTLVVSDQQPPPSLVVDP